MERKKTGISPDLIIHPGETIAEILEERNITQAELATRTGVSPAYVSNVISGKKDISTKFAMGLEYALGVPKTFWLNLQANYDAELLEFNEQETITKEEEEAYRSLGEVIRCLRKRGLLPKGERMEKAILSLRKVLQISNIGNLGELVPEGAFRIASKTAVDPYVLGAWLRLCQISATETATQASFDKTRVNELVLAVKKIMLDTECDLQHELATVMQQYGIEFSVVQNFAGAPVHGYISQKQDGGYQMVLTIRGAFADIFWFSLFHEIGHIVNGDVLKGARFIDAEREDVCDKEKAADEFASNALLDPKSYDDFIGVGDYSLSSICRYAAEQDVMPYIVIGRLQKERHIPYTWFSKQKLRYKWA